MSTGSDDQPRRRADEADRPEGALPAEEWRRPREAASEPPHGTDELARRLSRVRHLYPFRIDVKETGRLRCELNCSPEELTPEAARELLRALEPIVDRIRAVAGQEE